MSSSYEGDWTPNYIPLFARHYPRRIEGEEVHDAIAKATGVLGSYQIQYFDGVKLTWAMQLPEPAEPRGNEGNANVFMNTFFRGNRDNQQRNQSGSIQQQLYLMNDQFVTNRVKVAASPKLKALTADYQRFRSDRRGVSHLPVAIPDRLRAVESASLPGQGDHGRLAQYGRRRSGVGLHQQGRFSVQLLKGKKP